MATTTTTNADNPIATPPANQTNQLTSPGGGYVSADAEIQAKVAAMQSQAVAQSSQAAKPAAPSSVPVYSPPTQYTTQPQTQTTTTPQSGAAKEADIRSFAASAPQGTAYNPETGTYQDVTGISHDLAKNATHFAGYGTGRYDPMTGQEILQATPLAGQGANVGMRFTSDLARAIKPSLISPEDKAAMDKVTSTTGGVLTTDGYKAGGDAAYKATVNMQLPENQTFDDLNPNWSFDQSIKESIASAPDYLKPLLLAIESERALLAKRLEDPNNDPMFKMLSDRIKVLDERSTADVARIESSYREQYDDQVELNKKTEGMAKMFIAGTGFSTSQSNQALAYMTETLNTNAKTLRGINDAKNEAIRKSQEAYADQDYQLAAQQVQMAESYRKDYRELLKQSADIQLQAEELTMKRAEFMKDMEAKDLGNAKAAMELLASGKVDPDLVPESKYATIGAELGTDAAGAKSIYTNMLESSQATDYNDRLAKAMEAASKVTDMNTEIALPTPEGGTTFVKRSEIQIPGDYESFDKTENGIKYRVYVDKSKLGQPGVDPVVSTVPLGSADPDVIHITGSDNSVWAYDKNTRKATPILDFAGDAVSGTEAMYNLGNNVPGNNYPSSPSVSNTQGTGIPSGMDFRQIFPEMPPSHPTGVARDLKGGESISEYSNNPGAITFSYSGSRKETDIIQTLRGAGIEVTGVDFFGKPVVDSAGNKLAVFQSIEDGYRAFSILMSSSSYSGLDLAHAMGRYSGTKDAQNRNMGYANYVSSRTGIPVSGVTLGSLNDYQKLALAQAQYEWESGKRGKGLISFSDVPFGSNAGDRSPEPGNLMAKNVTWDDVKRMKSKSVGVDDGSQSKIVGKDLYIGNTVKNGKVEKVTDIGIEDGQTLKSIQVRDMDSGLLYSFYGVKGSTLQVGSKWDSSKPTPPVGTASKDGYSETIANADGSAIKPTPLPATLEEANAKYSWGTPGKSVSLVPKAATAIKAKIADLKAGGNFYSVISDIKNDSQLSKFDSKSYMGSLYDAAQIGKVAMDKKRIDAENAEKRGKSMDMTTLKKASALWAQQNSIDNVAANLMKFTFQADLTVSRIEEAHALLKEKELKGEPVQIMEDTDLLDSFVEVAKGGGTTVPMHLVDNILGGRSWQQQLKMMRNKITKSVLLTPEERDSVLAMGQKISEAYLKKGKSLIDAQKKALLSNPETAGLAAYITDDVILENTLAYNEAKKNDSVLVTNKEEVDSLEEGSKFTYNGVLYQKTSTGAIKIK